MANRFTHTFRHSGAAKRSPESRGSDARQWPNSSRAHSDYAVLCRYFSTLALWIPGPASPSRNDAARLEMG